MTWYWMGLGLCVQWAVLLGWPRRYAKGRLTKPMYFWPLIGSKLPSRVRFKQLIFLWAVEVILDYTTATSDLFLVAGFWLAVIILYLDDYLFGDDDGKKRWESIRNKVKWRMELPEPVKAKDTA